MKRRRTLHLGKAEEAEEDAMLPEGNSPIRCRALAEDSPLPIFFTGPPLEEGPLPAFLYFALSGEESLTLDPFNQSVAFLQGTGCRCFSFTIPFHGPEYARKKAMGYWAHAIEEGTQLIQQFIEQCRTNLDFLQKEGWLESDKIAVGGLSRGGFLATHLAAADARVGSVIGYAPLTALEPLEEFSEKVDHSQLAALGLESLIPRLIDKQIFFSIGNRDTRVSTQRCIRFFEKLVEAMYASGQRTPPAELRLYPSIGHKGHGTPPEVFLQGIEWLKNQWSIT